MDGVGGGVFPFFKNYDLFKTETMARVWWPKTFWKIKAQYNTPYHRFIKRCVYFFNRFAEVENECNFVFTLFNEQTFSSIPLTDVILQLLDIIDVKQFKGFSQPRQDCFYVFTFVNKEVRDKVAKELCIVDTDFVVSSDWIKKSYRKKISVKWLPADKTEVDIVKVLDNFMYDIVINREQLTLSNGISVNSGDFTGSVLIKDNVIEEDIPHIFFLDNYMGLLIIYGRPALCFRCLKVGHLGKNCNRFKYVEKSNTLLAHQAEQVDVCLQDCFQGKGNLNVTMDLNKLSDTDLQSINEKKSEINELKINTLGLFSSSSGQLDITSVVNEVNDTYFASSVPIKGVVGLSGKSSVTTKNKSLTKVKCDNLQFQNASTSFMNTGKFKKDAPSILDLNSIELLETNCGVHQSWLNTFKQNIGDKFSKGSFSEAESSSSSESKGFFDGKTKFNTFDDYVNSLNLGDCVSNNANFQNSKNSDSELDCSQDVDSISSKGKFMKKSKKKRKRKK